MSAPADALGYVLKTWGMTQEQHLPSKPSPGFLKEFAQTQARIIQGGRVLCAMKGETIAGFIVFTQRELHWLQVRREYRHQGIGRKLLDAAFTVVPVITTWTPDLRHLGLSNAPYTPFWLRAA